MPGTLAALITERRGKRNDAYVAGILDVDPTSVSRWRRGAGWPTPEHYPRLAKWLDIPVSRLADIVAEERSAVGITKYKGEQAARKEILDLITALTERVTALERRLPPDPPSPRAARRRPPKS